MLNSGYLEKMSKVEMVIKYKDRVKDLLKSAASKLSMS